MKFSMTRQEKGDLLIQVTAWAGMSVYVLYGLSLIRRFFILTKKSLGFTNCLGSGVSYFHCENVNSKYIHKKLQHLQMS